MEILRRYRKIFTSCIKIRGTLFIEKAQVCIYVPQRNYISLSRQHLKLNYSECEMCRRLNNNLSDQWNEHLDHKILELCESIKDGRIFYEQLEEIISIYEKTDHILQYSISILLLKSCGELLPDVAPEARQDLANRVWNILTKKKYKLMLEHYNTLLSVCEENCHFVNPDTFLKEMNVTPNVNTYYHLLTMATKTGNEKSATDVISKMVENNISLDESTYNALIRMYAYNSNIEKALKVIQTMQDEKIMPTSETYAKLAYGYAKLGDKQSLMELLKTHKFIMQDFIEIIKILSLSGHKTMLPDVIKFFESPLQTDMIIIKNAIVEFIRDDCIADARMIMLSLICKCEEKTERELLTYFIKELVKLDSPVQRILEFVEDMSNIEHIHSPILKIAEFVLREASDTVCLAILDEMHKRNIEVRPHYYWPILINTFKVKGENGVYAVLQHALSLNIDLDNDTFKDYVFPYINIVEPIVMLQKMKKIGISSKRIFIPLIIFLIENERLTDCIDIYKRMYIKIDYKHIIKHLVAQCTKPEYVEKCVTLLLMLSDSEQKFFADFLICLVKYNKNDIKPNVITALLHEINKNKIVLSESHKEIVLKYCKDISVKDYHTVSQLLVKNSEFTNTEHPTKISTNYTEGLSTTNLSCHLIELQSKGMSVRGTLRKLFIKYCNENNVKKVQEITCQFDSHKYKWTAGMRSNLFDLYSCNNMIKEAEEQLKILRSSFPGFEIDKFKIINYANALVKVDRIQEAITIIEQYKYPVCVNVNTSCWKLLKTICDSTHRNHIHEIVLLLVQNGYCTIDNRILGPIIKASILENDLQSAVVFFKKCALSYKMLPLKQELLSELVKQNETQSVKTVMEIHNLIQDILGMEIANTCLLIALAECQKTQLIEDFLGERKMSSNTLVNQLKSLPDEKRLKVSLELFKANKTISNVDTTCVCDIILSIYSKFGNCNDAISLWREMKAQCTIPTTNFKTGFIQLLKTHKFPVPEEFYTNGAAKENV